MKMKLALLTLASLLACKYSIKKKPRAVEIKRRRQEKENKLRHFARKLQLKIPYATLHSDRYPPDSVEDARARIAYLKRQDARTLRQLLAQIKQEGGRLKCSRKAIIRAQKKIRDVEMARIAETRLLEKWILDHYMPAPCLLPAAA